MADPLYELLTPYFPTDSSRPAPSPKDPVTTSYLNRLTTLPIASLTSSEPQALAQSTHSITLSLQGLSSRSHPSVIASSTHLSSLQTTLPAIAISTSSLHEHIPALDAAALHFSETYNKHTTTSNVLLERRKKALLLSRNVDRLQDILDLPTLLSSAISSSGANAPSSSTASASSSATLNYASALDLNAHIRRLQVLYPSSGLVAEVSAQADEAMQAMATNLISSLRTQGVKLAAAIRTISWLRRVAPELDTQDSTANKEGSLGALFLVCRLANLMAMLGALEPLRELAEQESERRSTIGEKETASSSSWSGGQQTERYLKRYIEIFREQSFAIISVFRSIFPHDTEDKAKAEQSDPLQPLPSALATFPLYLVDMLQETLMRYLPNVRDRSSRDSLLTQVLYCAGSLGRLGGDFSMMLAFLDEEEDDDEDDDDEDEGDAEWVEVIKKHRALAGRLELMVGSRDA